MAAARYRLALVPVDADVPTAAEVLLPPGTREIQALAHWTVTDPDGKFEGGTASIRMTVPPEELRIPPVPEPPAPGAR